MMDWVDTFIILLIVHLIMHGDASMSTYAIYFGIYLYSYMQIRVPSIVHGL
jgi:hypothetical protein